MTDLPTQLRNFTVQTATPTNGEATTSNITPLEELEKQAILHAIQLLDATSWKLHAAWASARPRCIAN